MKHLITLEGICHHCKRIAVYILNECCNVPANLKPLPSVDHFVSDKEFWMQWAEFTNHALKEQ